jgi:O-antigen/teichoic acid export membrane protein
MKGRGLLGLMRDALIYGAGSVISQVASFLLLPLYSKELTTADLGVVTLFSFFPVLMMTFSTAGIKSAVYYYFHKVEGDDRAKMLSVGTWVPIAGALMVSLLAVLLRVPVVQFLTNDTTHADTFLLVIAAGFMGTIGEVPRVVLQSQQRAREVAISNVAQVFVTLIITLLLVLGLHLRAVGVLSGQLAGASVGTLTAIWAARDAFGRSFDRSWWKKMSTYGLPYLPHRIMGIAMTFFAESLIARRIGLEETGLYGMAMRFLIPVTLITGAIQQAWQPYKFKLVQEEQQPAQKLGELVTLCFVAFAFLWFASTVWAEHLLVWMVDASYHPSVRFLAVACLLKVVQGFYPMMSTGLDVGPSAKAIPIGSLVGLLAMLACAEPLLAWETGRGAVLAATVGWSATAMAFWWLSQRSYPIPFAYLQWLLSALLAAGLYLAHQHVLTTAPLLAQLARDVVLTVLFPLCMLPVLVASPSQRAQLHQVLGALMSKVKRKLRIGGK